MGKVLIITYYWPPSAGGGVQRWLKFAKFLPEFGWEPVIFTPENPAFEQKDDSLLSDVSEDLEVIHFPIWEPLHIFQKLKGKKGKERKQGIVSEKARQSWLDQMIIWIRGNLFVPDPRKYWVKPSVAFLTPLIEEKNIDAVITTGPPHSMHLVGKRLKKKTGVKWISDFRDPWSDWDILDDLKTGILARYFHRKAEESVLKESDSILTVSNKLKGHFSEKVSIENLEVITNGLDKEDLNSSEESFSLKKFRVTHLGLINHMRNPMTFWTQLERKCLENSQFAVDLEIFLAGAVDQRILDFLGKSEVLREKLIYQDYVPHKEISGIYQDSSVLLLLMNRSKNAEWLIPGKLFEYMAANRSILAFGSVKSEVNQILVDHGGNGVVEYEDDGETSKRLDELYQSFIDKTVSIKYRNMDQFERRNLTGELAKVLNRVTARS